MFFKTTELIPKGVKKTKGYDLETYVMRRPYVQPGEEHQNTFDVEEKFEKLQNGVRFNVETLPKPKEEHAHKTTIERSKLMEQVLADATAFYSSEYKEQVEKKKVGIEVVFDDLSGRLVGVGANSFFISIVTAFAQHLPLTLSPDHIWTVIGYSFAKHVEANSEALRDKFVQHKGKKRILIETKGDFKKAAFGKPNSGASPERWEKEIFSQFSEQIKAAIGEKTHSVITSSFSTTTAASRAATEISLMASMQSYFSMGMRTRCGIPDITLLGTPEDWQNLRESAKELGTLMIPEFSESWMSLLLPVLDKFVDSSNGIVDHGFWQSMVKLRTTGVGSGAYDIISGWIQIFFPYLSDGSLNNGLRPWNEMYFTGPEPTKIPSILSSVPVDWTYIGIKYNLHFHGGFSGFTQDSRSGLSPCIGWFVSLDPPMPTELELKKVQKEISDLWLGHENDYDYKNKTVDKEAPFFIRLVALEKREKKLMNSLESSAKILQMRKIEARKSTKNFIEDAG